NLALSQSIDFGPPPNAGDPLTYSLFALRSPGAMVLRVTPVGDGLLPSKDFRSEDGKPESFGLLELGDYGEGVRVSGQVVDAENRPIVNAVVLFDGKVRGGGSYTADAKTLDGQAPGRFEVTLLPTADGGKYKITVRPPPESRYASASFEAEVPMNVPAGASTPAPVTLPTITCPLKTALRGSVNDLQGKPLGGIVVQIEPNTGALNPGTSRVETLTDDGGNYELSVEPGAYRVAVKPAFSRRLPWSSRRIVASGAQMQVPTILLSEARIVDGTVVWHDGGRAKLIPNANVTIYRVPESHQRHRGVQAIKLYEAVSDAQGRFQVVLPRSAGADEPDGP
ncbi:MAG: collagen binding domain-containing protein, partial [Myxococcales bacterium]